jgi:plasmid stabilization system protein ParE
VKQSRISLSDAAANDILTQADWYEQQANARLGKRWDSSVTQAILRIVKNPRSGALCTFKTLELRNVRRVPIAGFRRHLIFYRVERAPCRFSA